VKLRALIVDDEAPARRLRRILDELDEVDVVADATDGLDARRKVAEHAPDVVFLDVEMPRLDGLAVARLARDSEVVFVSAHERYAVQAFEVEAADYVLKPVSHRSVVASVDRVLRRRAHARPLVDTNKPLRLRATSGKSLYFFEAAKVQRFYGAGKYAALSSDRREYLLEQGLGQVEALLEEHEPGAYFRCHRSELIRLSAIVAIHQREHGIHIELEDGQVASVSRRALPALRKAMSV
jgi:DNA-binding LytR/AlgR family response regulator